MFENKLLLRIVNVIANIMFPVDVVLLSEQTMNTYM